MFVGTVSELWWYPVKSLKGERLERARFAEDGIPGDRAMAFVDPSTGHALSGKRVAKLMHARADAEGITLPDGLRLPIDDAEIDERLSAWLGRPVRLARAPGHGVRTVVDSEEATFTSAAGTFHDSSPLHFVTTATLGRFAELYPTGRFDPRRFRPNVVLETPRELKGFVEQEWLGRTLRIGTVTMRITKGCGRCVMTTLPQDDLEHDRGILQTVARENDNIAGVLATVTVPGEIARGDDALLLEH
jgi:uncharacterized protein YcbX